MSRDTPDGPYTGAFVVSVAQELEISPEQIAQLMQFLNDAAAMYVATLRLLSRNEQLTIRRNLERAVEARPTGFELGQVIACPQSGRVTRKGLFQVVPVWCQCSGTTERNMGCCASN
jgi:hypothetical protein